LAERYAIGIAIASTTSRGTSSLDDGSSIFPPRSDSGVYLVFESMNRCPSADPGFLRS